MTPRRASAAATQLPPIPEKAIQGAVCRWLDLMGVLWIRINSGMLQVEDQRRRRGKRFIPFNSARGCSDVLACLPGGRFAAIEVKRADGRLTIHQELFLKAVREKGGIGIVVRSIDELEAALREHLPRRGGNL